MRKKFVPASEASGSSLQTATFHSLGSLMSSLSITFGRMWEANIVSECFELFQFSVPVVERFLTFFGKTNIQKSCLENLLSTGSILYQQGEYFDVIWNIFT